MTNSLSCSIRDDKAKEKRKSSGDNIFTMYVKLTNMQNNTANQKFDERCGYTLQYTNHQYFNKIAETFYEKISRH